MGSRLLLVHECLGLWCHDMPLQVVGAPWHASLEAQQLRELNGQTARSACDAVQELSLQHITNIMWALASFDHKLPCVPKVFVPELVKRMGRESFNAQQLCNLLWSQAIMQVSINASAKPNQFLTNIAADLACMPCPK